MNQSKELTKKAYQTRDEIVKDFFLETVNSEESQRGKTEKSKSLDEETLRQIQQLFCAR